MIFENKVDQKLKLSRKYFYKKRASKLVQWGNNSERLSILDKENSPQSRGADYAQPLAVPHLNVFMIMPLLVIEWPKNNGR